ncbi:hypothetical protein XO47_15185 [Listeria monocytogenes]|nr:hypothetical protein [Listeria monocytogenes]
MERHLRVLKKRVKQMENHLVRITTESGDDLEGIILNKYKAQKVSKAYFKSLGLSDMEMVPNAIAMLREVEGKIIFSQIDPDDVATIDIIIEDGRPIVNSTRAIDELIELIQE